MTNMEEKVNNMLNKLKINISFPVSLMEIAEKLGYKVVCFKVNDKNANVSGAVLYDEKTIYLNPYDNRERQRFTLAHEIAHIVLGHKTDGKYIDYRDCIDKPITQEEIDANKFAAELLMPTEEFKKQWYRECGDILKIANYFVSSLSATTFRAKELGFLNDW